MATSVLLACGLTDHKLPSYIQISEDSGVDGSFLISCILGQKVRVPDSKVIFVCLHHTFEHYCSSGMRLGYNLKGYIGKSLFVIDRLTQIYKSFEETKSTLNDHYFSVNELWKEIETQIENLLPVKKTATIIIDDLSILLNLGANKSEVIRFAKILSTQTDKGWTVITKINNSEVFKYIVNNIKTLSGLYIEIQKFQSGNFREVDGKLIINKRYNHNLINEKKTVLYKVNDRNVKTFNPGEIGIRI